MRKTAFYIVVFALVAFLFGGCATWHGIKKDTSHFVNVIES